MPWVRHYAILFKSSGSVQKAGYIKISICLMYDIGIPDGACKFF